MSIPSFDEILSEARKISESRQEAKYSTLTAQSVSDFANKLLNTPTGERNTYVGEVNPQTGQYRQFTQPVETGQTLAEKGFSALFGGNKEKVTQGSIPITQKQFGEHGLSQVFKPKEQMVYQNPKDPTDIRLEPTVGFMPIPTKTGSSEIGKNYRQSEALKYKLTDNMPAIDSGYALEEQVKQLFPKLPQDKIPNVSVGMVKQRESLNRAIEMSRQRPATAEEIKDLTSGDVMKTQIETAKRLGEKTGWAGVGIGDYDLAKIGQYDPTGLFKTNPDVTTFISTVQDLKNQLIYLRSGKQINEQEYNRLDSAMPRFRTTPETFKTDLARFENVFNDTMKSRENRILGAGRRTGGGKETIPAKTNQPTNNQYTPQQIQKMKELGITP